MIPSSVNTSQISHSQPPLPKIHLSGWKTKIIDRKIHGKSLCCFQEIAHRILFCISKKYRTVYHQQKKLIGPTPYAPKPKAHAPQATAPSVPTASSNNALALWLTQSIDTSIKSWTVGDAPNADINWKTPAILMFGTYDRADGYHTGKLQRLERHGKNHKADYLSNFYMCYLTIDGKKYKSVEHYYQAMKFHIGGPVYKQIVAAKDANTARKIAQDNKSQVIINLGDDQALADIMKKALIAKFLNPDGSPTSLGVMLKKTGTQPLIEGNRRIGQGGQNYSDKRWGAEFDFTNYPEITLTGQNMLGTLLSEVRDFL